MNKKRAIIWLAWGEKHVVDASESRKSVEGMGYVTCLITDQETAASNPLTSAFDIVVPADFRLGGHLRKCELWRWLPQGFDSFLFLDADTRVLMDLSLGFDKAEQYGLAVAQAPHYSLDHFWGFSEVMRQEGVALRGQLQYNSGVIFFCLQPDVEEVFRKWEELASEYGGTMDQPFLTLAMELVGFNPYTLSTSYNHRAVGEFISGNVRIWHSYLPVPEELNLKPGGALRRIVKGKLEKPPGRLHKKMQRLLSTNRVNMLAWTSKIFGNIP